MKIIQPKPALKLHSSAGFRHLSGLGRREWRLALKTKENSQRIEIRRYYGKTAR